MWRYAGIVGCEPWTFTLRQLEAMAEARLKSQWNHTAAILHELHENKRMTAIIGKLKPPPARSAVDYHPYRSQATQQQQEVAALPKLPVSVLKNIFVDQ